VAAVAAAVLAALAAAEVALAVPQSPSLRP
jgi:hypothetical protein